jgi:hypothetical protein
MTATIEEVSLDIDFDKVPQCEFYGHPDPISIEMGIHEDGPAKFMLVVKCPQCGCGGPLLACEARAIFAGSDNKIMCDECDHKAPAYEFLVRANRL